MKVKVWIAAVWLVLATPFCSGYSFLTHETLIDMAWESSIRPVLLSRYPHATPAQLREARAYAYGGSTIQDAGYYPFGHILFSNLTHYVRTGDFVTNLIRESRNIDELAFALGAMSHYVGDTIGHRYAVNLAIPQEFPKLEQQYGNVVTYEENEHAEVRTEFGFDIDQLSHERFAPAGYLRRVGFRVPVGLLNRAFYATYGIHLRGVLGDEFPAIRSYRWAVRRFLLHVAYAEVLLHRKEFPQDVDNADFVEFQQQLKKTSAECHWERYRRHEPSFETRVFAVLIFILPKVGPLSDMAIPKPKLEAEEEYVSSVDRADAEYAELLAEVTKEGQHRFSIPDLDLDTGYVTRPGTYRLTDVTYAQLLHRVTEKTAMPPLGLRKNILAYYSDPAAPIYTKRFPRKWKKLQAELAELRAMPATRIPDVK